MPADQEPTRNRNVSGRPRDRLVPLCDCCRLGHDERRLYRFERHHQDIPLRLCRQCAGGAHVVVDRRAFLGVTR